MMVKKLKYFSCFYLSIIFVFLIFSCSENEPKSESISDDLILIEESILIDSVLNSLSPKQIYYQHLSIEIPKEAQLNLDSLKNWIIENEPGALYFKQWEINNIQNLHLLLDSISIIKPFFISDYYEVLNSKPYDYVSTNKKIRKNNFLELFQQCGIEMIDYSSFYLDNQSSPIIDSLEMLNQSFFITHSFHNQSDFSLAKNILKNKKASVFLQLNGINNIKWNDLKIEDEFEGLFFIKTNDNCQLLIENGIDFIYISKIKDIPTFSNTVSQECIESTKNILLKKERYSKNIKNNDALALKKYTQLNLQHKSTALLSNKNNLIPTKNIKNIQLKEFSKKEIKQICEMKGVKYIIIPDTIIDLEFLKEIQSKDNLVICFSQLNLYEDLKTLPHLVFIPPLNNLSKDILEEQFLGNLSFEGDFCIENKKIKGEQIKQLKLSRLNPEFTGIDSKKLYKINSMVSNAIAGQSFPGCQVLVAKNGSIIYDKYFGHHTYSRELPVSQNSVYDIASLTKIVSTTLMGMRLYDLNEYKLKDSIGKFFPDTLSKHLKFPNTIKNITFQELFIHKSGLPSGFPIFKYMSYTNNEIGRFDKYYCDTKDETFCVQVAENYYLEKEYKDSMWIKLHQIWVDDSKQYKYSDVNMNTLYFLFQSMIHNNLQKFGFTQKKDTYKDKDLYEEYLYTYFYRSLEMNSTYYNPLRFIPKNRIVPTENETFWRKQLLQGYVHDPNAALYGGVAGNAGIFTTTNDLAILLQMLLNKGEYNGKRYIQSETVEKFIQTQEGTHRGLGFNKRTYTNAAYAMADSASVNTYGHTGFTGTCFWIDPDNELIYIFFSNRVHPKVSNNMYKYGIRKNVHQAFYDAMLF